MWISCKLDITTHQQAPELNLMLTFTTKSYLDQSTNFADGTHRGGGMPSPLGVHFLNFL